MSTPGSSWYAAPGHPGYVVGVLSLERELIGGASAALVHGPTAWWHGELRIVRGSRARDGLYWPDEYGEELTLTLCRLSDWAGATS